MTSHDVFSWAIFCFIFSCLKLNSSRSPTDSLLIPTPSQLIVYYIAKTHYTIAMATDIYTRELRQPVDVAEYLFRRLQQIGIRSVHGVPGKDCPGIFGSERVANGILR